MENCIFCKIVAGEIPADKIWENEKVLVFLDANPLSKGHTLVIPKKHFVDFFDTEEDYLKEIMDAIKKISSSIRKSLGAKGFNIFNNSGKSAQQSVFHLHFHIIPRYENDELNTWPASDYKEEDFEGVAKKIKNI